jgi:NAD(P)-dependent dehydrogenase (short-subunit alcohol dehydrogenase family)
VNPTYDFTGQVALVTGASSGMGLATAQAFAAAGAAVVLADIDQDALNRTMDKLTTTGHQALAVVCDVTDEDQVAAMVDTTVATFGRLDAAFNNAGIQVPPHDAADEPAEVYDRVNAVCPGTIDTPMVADMIAKGELDLAAAVADQPIGRLGRAEEIAAAVLWLCSPAAGFIVGVALPVDGGYVAR